MLCDDDSHPSPRESSLEEWAVGEAIRLIHRNVDKAAAAQAAARRAPGIKAAAQALGRLCAKTDDAFLNKAIPATVRDHIAGEPPSDDDRITSRVEPTEELQPSLARCVNA